MEEPITSYKMLTPTSLEVQIAGDRYLVQGLTKSKKEIRGIAWAAVQFIHGTSIKQFRCIYFEDKDTFNFKLFADGATRNMAVLSFPPDYKQFTYVCYANRDYVLDLLRFLYKNGESRYSGLINVAKSKQNLETALFDSKTVEAIKLLEKSKPSNGLSAETIDKQSMFSIRIDGIIFKKRYIDLTESGKKYANALTSKSGYVDIIITDSKDPKYLKVLQFSFQD